jgi:hypothetical protein
MLSRMDGFALSERWNGWEDLDVMVQAARAAVEAGPLDPLVCTVAIEGDEDDVTLTSLEELEVLLSAGEDPLTIEIYVAHVVEDEASLTIFFNGRWLQINGAGTDWARARQAYNAAQVELALRYGITTFKLPQLPTDTVADVRKRVGAKDRDPGRLGGDEQPPRPGV